MTYRCEVDVSFEKEEDYISFLNLMQKEKAKIYIGSEKDTIATNASIRHYECRHDEASPIPCGVSTPYNYVDLKKKEVEVFKTKAGQSVSADAIIGEIKKER